MMGLACVAQPAHFAYGEGPQHVITPQGVDFGIWGDLPQEPVPTLFVFAGSMETTLDGANNGYYRQCAKFLQPKGYLCVSLDLPCHGKDHRAEESEGLRGWRERAEAGHPVMESFVNRVRDVIDYLVQQRATDPQRIAACGISRGGFAALHLAAREPRVAAVAAFAPVTDLAALHEFAGAEELPAVQALSLSRAAAQLAGRPIWLIIGDQDHRVGTDHAIRFARSVSRASQEAKIPGGLELHVIPESAGHTVAPAAFEQAAQWIDQQFFDEGAP